MERLEHVAGEDDAAGPGDGQGEGAGGGGGRKLLIDSGMDGIGHQDSLSRGNS